MFPLRGSRISEGAVSEKGSSLPENLLPADTQALLNISYRSDAAAGADGSDASGRRWSFITERREIATPDSRVYFYRMASTCANFSSPSFNTFVVYESERPPAFLPLRFLRTSLNWDAKRSGRDVEMWMQFGNPGTRPKTRRPSSIPSSRIPLPSPKEKAGASRPL